MSAEPNPEIKQSIVSAIADGDTVDWEAVTLPEGADAHEVEALQLLAALRGPPLPETPFTPLDTGFDVIEEIGRGSFGQVFLARDRVLGREVALKILREDRVAGAEARERFLREARILAQIEHPNVVRLYSIDEQGTRLRLSFERLSGETLDRRVKRAGALDAEEVARIGLSLCSALTELHARGIVHGDLKPANVMRTTDGRIVLLDFGIARGPQSNVDRREQVVPEGTPLYMAPEVFDGAASDHRADLFALGAMLCWLSCGKLPFVGADAFEIRALQSRGAPLDELLADAPSRLKRLIARCLAEDRAERPADAAEVARELSVLAYARTRRRRMLIGAAASLLIGAAGYFTAMRYFETPARAELLALRGEREQRLKDGDRVVEGERIVLEVGVDEPRRVYVFNEDDAGAVNVLESGVTIEPQTAAAQSSLRFPGEIAGTTHEWVLGAGGKAEYFVVVISEQAIPEAEELAREAQSPARQSDPVALNDPTRSVGLKRAVVGPGVEIPSEEGTRIGALVERIGKRDGVFVRVWRLNRGDG